MISSARFVLSIKRVIEKYREMQKLADVVSYSYKTNPEVAKILENNTDSYFSVHSLANLKNLNCPERVWFFAQAWNSQELDILFKSNISKFIVDNKDDLKILIEYINDNDKEISLLLRMKLKEHTIHTGKHYVYGMYSSKINSLIPILKTNKNIVSLGIHFHRKTQNVSEWSIKSELKETISTQNLSRIDFINIGGGIPAQYKNYNVSVIENIFKKISDCRKWLKKQGIKVIIEPGRYIAAPSIVLETNIKAIYNNNIIIDCSVYNAAMDTFVANIRLLVKGELETGNAYTIKGCTPDSMDIFRYKVYLKNPKIGDKIIFLNAGAYNYSSDFCNLPKLQTLVV